MKIIKVSPANLNSVITEAVRVLKSGGVIAHPTDTVWGLACDAGNEKATRKIHALKKSDPSKPLLLNLPSKSYLNKIGSKLCKARKLAKEFWPGALSLLVLAKNSKGKLGVRLPDHELSAALARKFGKPLTTTSANLSGERVAKDGREVVKIFPKVDLILDDRSSSKNNPSTLIDVSEKEVKLIREGGISLKAILRTLSSRS